MDSLLLEAQQPFRIQEKEVQVSTSAIKDMLFIVLKEIPASGRKFVLKFSWAREKKDQKFSGHCKIGLRQVK